MEMCVCVCARGRARARVCERERESERERDLRIESDRERENDAWNLQLHQQHVGIRVAARIASNFYRPEIFVIDQFRYLHHKSCIVT